MNIKTILKDEMTQSLIKSLGIENETPESQAEIIAQVGENILGRVTLAMLEIAPKEKHEEFAALMDAGDFEGIQRLLGPHVPQNDVGEFARATIRREISETKEIVKKRLAAV